MLVKTEGIVIRTRDYGESHKVVVLFTRERGKSARLARGAKKPRSRLGAVTQLSPMANTSVFSVPEWAPSPRGSYLLPSRPSLGSFFDGDGRLPGGAAGPIDGGYGAFACVVPAAFPPPWINWRRGIDPDILSRIFELRVLEAAGYRPVRQVRPLWIKGPSRTFQRSSGRFLCTDCLHRDERTIPLSENAARILRLLQRMTPDRIGKVRVKGETKDQLEQVLRAFIDEYTGIAFKSRPFLDQLRKGWSPSSDR